MFRTAIRTRLSALSPDCSLIYFLKLDNFELKKMYRSFSNRSYELNFFKQTEYVSESLAFLLFAEDFFPLNLAKGFQ